MNIGGDAITWPAGSRVVVFFDPYTVSPERMAIYKKVISNWEGTAGVTFTYDTSDPSQNFIMIRDVQPSNPARRAEEFSFYDINTGIRYGSEINMGTCITDNEALARSFSHEFGHPFGLNHPHNQADYYTTRTSNSYYRTENGCNDTSVGSVGPTDCDQNVIQTIFDEGGFKYGNPGGTGTGDSGGGGGGGGGECDCGDCVNGCNDPDPPCTDTFIPGSCYTVCVTYCDQGEIDPYTGNVIEGSQTCYEDCQQECDPGTWVCL